MLDGDIDDEGDFVCVCEGVKEGVEETERVGVSDGDTERVGVSDGDTVRDGETVGDAVWAAQNKACAKTSSTTERARTPHIVKCIRRNV